MENSETTAALFNFQTAIEGATGKEKEWGLACNKATTRVLNDQPTNPVDAALFFGRSWFDAERGGIYQLAVDLHQSGLVKKIAIYGNEGQKFGETDPAMLAPGSTFPKERRARMVAPAREIAKVRLIRMGVPVEDIILTQIPDPYKNNTIEEGLGFFIAAKSLGWTSVVAIANPHQLLREMLGLIQIMDKHPGYYLNIYSAAPANTDWERKGRGAQGEHFAPRKEHIKREIKRIKEYQLKGDLVSFDRYFDYLDNRH